MMDQSSEKSEPIEHESATEPEPLRYATTGSVNIQGIPLCSIIGCVLSLIAFFSFCMMGMSFAKSTGGHEWEGLGDALAGFFCLLCFAAMEFLGSLFLIMAAFKRQKWALPVLFSMFLLYGLVLLCVPSIRAGLVELSHHIGRAK